MRFLPVLAAAAILLGLSGLAQDNRAVDTSEAEESIERGAEVYAESCSVCHGATGLGIAEAKEAFPPDHRQCQRCHKVGNPPTMTLSQIEARQHDLFDIGTPPPLRGEVAMAAHAPPQALLAFIQSTMPRYRPAALSDDEYAAVTEYLLYLNGRR